MKASKKIVVSIAVLMLLIISSAAMASTGNSPVEIVAGLTGKTVDELYQLRNEGKKFGVIAAEAGQLEEFKAQMLTEKKAVLDQRVENGQLTQEEAGEIYQNIQENQANCDGTGGNFLDRGKGVCFGQGNGKGYRHRAGTGFGMRNRQ